jgi:hypothetical protein
LAEAGIGYFWGTFQTLHREIKLGGGKKKKVGEVWEKLPETNGHLEDYGHVDDHPCRNSDEGVEVTKA